MEYEISDEDVLFDESTNPSLQHEPDDAARRQSPGRSRNLADRRRLQRAELIPEEEQQLA